MGSHIAGFDSGQGAGGGNGASFAHEERNESQPEQAVFGVQIVVFALDRISAFAYILAMENTVAVLTALAEPTRLQAMRLLWDGREHCVCELMRALDATQSRMSRHMATLKAARLVVDRRDAQWVRYRRAPDLPKAVVALVDAALALPDLLERNAA